MYSLQIQQLISTTRHIHKYETMFFGKDIHKYVKTMNAIFEQNYTLELLIALKMAYSCCCFGLRGNLDFPDFLQKKFYNINNRGTLLGCVTKKKSPNVYKSCPTMISLEK